MFENQKAEMILTPLYIIIHFYVLSVTYIANACGSMQDKPDLAKYPKIGALQSSRTNYMQ